MTPGIHHDENKNQEAYSEEHDDPGPAFPNLFYSRGKLGPIHVVGTLHRKVGKINGEFGGTSQALKIKKRLHSEPQ